jgi:hypothetical protein
MGPTAEYGKVLTNAVAVAGGLGRGLALTDAGTLVGWGWNAFGLAVHGQSLESSSRQK